MAVRVAEPDSIGSEHSQLSLQVVIGVRQSGGESRVHLGHLRLSLELLVLNLVEVLPSIFGQREGDSAFLFIVHVVILSLHVLAQHIVKLDRRGWHHEGRAQLEEPQLSQCFLRSVVYCCEITQSISFAGLIPGLSLLAVTHRVDQMACSCDY